MNSKERISLYIKTCFHTVYMINPLNVESLMYACIYNQKKPFILHSGTHFQKVGTVKHLLKHKTYRCLETEDKKWCFSGVILFSSSWKQFLKYFVKCGLCFKMCHTLAIGRTFGTARRPVQHLHPVLLCTWLIMCSMLFCIVLLNINVTPWKRFHLEGSLCL